MTDKAAMILGIINNPSAHVVNRAEKMERTIDVMVNNISKKQAERDNYDSANAVKADVDYGYGRNNGRGTGD